MTNINKLSNYFFIREPNNNINKHQVIKVLKNVFIFFI